MPSKVEVRFNSASRKAINRAINEDKNLYNEIYVGMDIPKITANNVSYFVTKALAMYSNDIRKAHEKAMQAIKDKLKHAQIILCERGDLACGKCFNCKELNKIFAHSNTKTKEDEKVK